MELNDLVGLHELSGSRRMTEKEIEAGLERLRSIQRKKVMRVIGPLLDEWDGLPNDVSGMPELKGIRSMIGRLHCAIGRDSERRLAPQKGTTDSGDEKP